MGSRSPGTIDGSIAQALTGSGLIRPCVGRRSLVRWLPETVVGIALLVCAGCAGTPSSTDGPMVIFLDGAGWSGSTKSIRTGLRDAGFGGHVETFSWTSHLGAGPDHFWVARKKQKGAQLAARVQERRIQQPDADLHLMGFSAGAAVVVFALEQLPSHVSVNNVVFFEPSISSEYDLSEALKHVRGHLYATSSPYDGILSGLRVNADGQYGRPAGLYGLRIPSRVKRYDLYARVVNLAWRPAYADLGWNGSHIGVIGEQFVQNVIAPRVLSTGPQPLNRPLAPQWMSRWRSPTSTVRSQ